MEIYFPSHVIIPILFIYPNTETIVFHVGALLERLQVSANFYDNVCLIDKTKRIFLEFLLILILYDTQIFNNFVCVMHTFSKK